MINLARKELDKEHSMCVTEQLSTAVMDQISADPGFVQRLLAAAEQAL